MPRVESQLALLSLVPVTLDAARMQQRSDLGFKERELLRRHPLRISGRRVDELLRGQRLPGKREADRSLHFRPSDHADRRTHVRSIRPPQAHGPMQTRHIEQPIRSQPQPHRQGQPARRARPLDGLFAIRTQHAISRRAPKRMALVVKHQSPRCLPGMLRPDFAHRSVELFGTSSQRLSHKVRDKQPPAIHRNLRHASRRRERDVRLPLPGRISVPLDLAIPLTRNQQLVAEPRHSRRAKQPPAVPLGNLDQRFDPTVATVPARIKPQHGPGPTRQPGRDQQPPVRIQQKNIRRRQPAQQRPPMRPAFQVIPLHPPRLVHQHQHLGVARPGTPAQQPHKRKNRDQIFQNINHQFHLNFCRPLWAITLAQSRNFP